MDREQALAMLNQAEYEDRLATSPLVEELALLGTFDPGRLAGVGIGGSVRRLLCRPLPSQTGRPETALIERRRIDAMTAMLRRGGRAELARVRDGTEPDFDTALQRVLDDFVRNTRRPATELDEDELLAALDVWRWATEAVARAELTRQVDVWPNRPDIEGRLALLEVVRPVRTLASAGCLGRDEELDRLHGYRRQPRAGDGLADDPAMVIYGVGGVGKSTLVARFVMDLYEESGRAGRWAWAYLDLDRPTLAACDAMTILNDIIRQVAAQFPEHRRELEHGEDIAYRRGKGAGLEAVDAASSYRDRAAGFARSSLMQDVSLVVVVDTFEELERRHPERAEELFGLFATLTSELRSFRLIVSGRGTASVFLAAARPDRQLAVLPLQEDAAVELLRFFVRKEARPHPPAIDEGVAREVIRLVGGIPLTVRLAARVLVSEGPGAVADAAARARALDRVRTEFVRGFLYQRILNHIRLPDRAATETLRQVAQASLVLRRVTVDLVERVLVPALRTPPAIAAADLFAGLVAQMSMVDREGGVLRLREELRGPALAALRFHDPKLVTRVHDLAVRFYETQPPSADTSLELAYHRLARGDAITAVDPDTLRRLGPSVADLPPASASVIREIQRHPGSFESSRDAVEWERLTVPEVDAALRRGDLQQARSLLARRTDRVPGTELYRLESRVEEAAGNLRLAVDASRRDVQSATAAADPTRVAAAAVRLAGLYELLGEAEDAEFVLQRTADLPLLAGRPELRLELLLNRMNALERGRLGTEDVRWSLGLDIRALIQRSGPQKVVSNTALVRLLAAALGREEPERLQQAIRLVGLGHEEDERRVRAIVSVVAAWDAGPPDPGRLARSLGLRLESADLPAIERAWTAVMGLGTDAGLLLDRLWRLEQPPESVREAVRAVYLWWAVDGGRRRPAAQSSHFLSEMPLDWSRPEIWDLEDILLTVYPTSTESRMLASATGIDMKQISWSGSARRVTRELIGTASRSGLLDQLVRTILTDPAAATMHGRIRSLVGADWLRAQGLT